MIDSILESIPRDMREQPLEIASSCVWRVSEVIAKGKFHGPLSQGNEAVQLFASINDFKN